MSNNRRTEERICIAQSFNNAVLSLTSQNLPLTEANLIKETARLVAVLSNLQDLSVEELQKMQLLA